MFECEPPKTCFECPFHDCQFPEQTITWEETEYIRLSRARGRKPKMPKIYHTAIKLQPSMIKGD